MSHPSADGALSAPCAFRRTGCPAEEGKLSSPSATGSHSLVAWLIDDVRASFAFPSFTRERRTHVSFRIGDYPLGSIWTQRAIG